MLVQIWTFGIWGVLDSKFIIVLTNF